MSDELNLIKIIGAISKELENECQDKVYAKEVGDEWYRQLMISGDVVAERNGDLQGLYNDLATKNTTINRQNDVIAVLKEGIDKLKAENEVLSKEHVIQGDALWSIGKRCTETKTSDADMDIAERVEWLASAHNEVHNKLLEMNDTINGTHHATSSLGVGAPTHSQLLKGIDNAIEEFVRLKANNKELDEEYSRYHSKSKAKASKLNAEKLKLIDLIRCTMAGYPVMKQYKAWLKEERKKCK